MQNRLPIIVSLLAGLLAVLLLNFYVEEVRRASRPALSQVMVAAHDLRPGAVLEAKDVAPANKPTAGIPALAIKWQERELYLGQPLELPVQTGDYVLASYFGGQSAAASRLSERIDAKQNQRALTIPVTTETSLERSIRPGDRVDLILTYSRTEIASGAAPGTGRAATQKLMTTSLLENVYVLFTGRFGATGRADYSTITVLLNPDEAKLLIWAMNLGKLSILLRNPKDLQPTDRSYLVGDASALNALGGQQMSIEQVISERRSRVEP